MLSYYCKPCKFFYRQVELGKGNSCPECGTETSPRLVLAGQVIGVGD